MANWPLNLPYGGGGGGGEQNTHIYSMHTGDKVTIWPGFATWGRVNKENEII